MIATAPRVVPVKPELPPLRGYQGAIWHAVRRSVFDGLGDTITVEIARQGGKNELSAHIEVTLLSMYSVRGGEMIKCAPTFRPQLRISMRRLRRALQQSGMLGFAQQDANSITLANARALFLSAEPSANVVGHTASILLEVDEAQDVDEEKFTRDFLPMTATANATIVMYGTPWDGNSLLERTKQHNLELERRDGRRRHFAFDWQRVARDLPAYAARVESERARLGETHPTFLTQYCLQPIASGGRLFTHIQRAQLAGDHEREQTPTPGASYIAALDLAGGDPVPVADVGADLRVHPPGGNPTRDATVLTIGRLAYPASDAPVQEPRVEIVEHYAWTGDPHEALLPRLIDLLRAWKVGRVAIDATGLGETIARLIAQALGEPRVIAFKFTARSKSQLGFDLLAAVNGSRLKIYRGDGSPEYREFQRQCELARATYRADETMNFYVDERDGHDDYLTSAALLVHASRDSTRRVASGRVRM